VGVSVDETRKGEALRQLGGRADPRAQRLDDGVRRVVFRLNLREAVDPRAPRGRGNEEGTDPGYDHHKLRNGRRRRTSPLSASRVLSFVRGDAIFGLLSRNEPVVMERIATGSAGGSPA